MLFAFVFSVTCMHIYYEENIRHVNCCNVNHQIYKFSSAMSALISHLGNLSIWYYSESRSQTNILLLSHNIHTSHKFIIQQNTDNYNQVFKSIKYLYIYIYINYYTYIYIYIYIYKLLMVGFSIHKSNNRTR